MAGPVVTTRLDAGDRTENPITGPSSDGATWSGPTQPGQDLLKCTTTGIMDNNDGSSNGHAHITSATFSADMEISCTLSVAPTGTDWAIMWIRCQNPGNVTTISSYYYFYQRGSPSQIVLGQIVNNGAPSGLSGGTNNTTVPQLVDGDKICCRIQGDTLIAEYYNSGVWTESHTCSGAGLISGAGTIGLELPGDNTVIKIIDVKGGSLPSAGMSATATAQMHCPNGGPLKTLQVSIKIGT